MTNADKLFKAFLKSKGDDFRLFISEGKLIYPPKDVLALMGDTDMKPINSFEDLQKYEFEDKQAFLALLFSNDWEYSTPETVDPEEIFQKFLRSQFPPGARAFLFNNKVILIRLDNAAAHANEHLPEMKSLLDVITSGALNAGDITYQALDLEHPTP